MGAWLEDPDLEAMSLSLAAVSAGGFVFQIMTMAG